MIMCYNDRIFKIDSLSRDDDGQPTMLCECLTLEPEDDGKKWWAFTVLDPDVLNLYTVH